MRLILEAYYEPQFSQTSHGFRRDRGCGTALTDIYHTWTGTKWFIEGDIAACFGSLDHQVMMSILGETIHDNRFLRLIENLLKAGYLEQWRYHATLSGSPQGGVISPILSNIYLDRLDKFVEHTLVPAYTRGLQRKFHAPYHRLAGLVERAKKAGRREQMQQYRKVMQQLPSRDPNDPNYRRLRYVRYADDFLLGFTGPRGEAEDIKRQIGQYLHDTLKLELSEQKTLITHARTETARFLGYEVQVLHEDSKRCRGLRSLNGSIGLRVPRDVLHEKCKRYMKGGKPVHLQERTNDTVFSIVAGYELEYAGLVNYYRRAYNLGTLTWLRYVMEVSLVRTVAHKMRRSTSQVWRQYQRVHDGRKVIMATVEREGRRPLVAMFGRTDLKWDPGARLDDSLPVIRVNRTELVKRLLANCCELCGSRESINVHHVRQLKDLKRPGRAVRPKWVEVMASRRRKTLVVCHKCHVDIHHGRLPGDTNSIRVTGEPDASKGARPVRRGADGKVPAVT